MRAACGVGMKDLRATAPDKAAVVTSLCPNAALVPSEWLTEVSGRALPLS
jgi:hypothetical protein